MTAGNQTVAALVGTGGVINSMGWTLTITDATGNYGGIITAGSVALTGGSQSFSGANAYGFGTALSGASTLTLSGAGTLGAGTGSTTITGGSTLDLGGTNQTQAAVTLTGGTLKSGTLASAVRASSGTNAFSNLAGTMSLTNSGGAGTVSGLNSYTGATLVSGGTLTGLNANAFSAGSTTTVTGGTLDLGGFSQAIGSLAGTGPVTNTGGNPVTLSLGGNNASSTFSGAIGDGTGVTALTKVGTGQQTLSGTNTYTGGTTVNGGLLRIGVDGGAQGTILGAVVNNAGLDFTTANVTGVTSITTNNGGVTQFYGPLTGLSAAITNAGTTTFRRTTDAGTASITNTAGTTNFIANANGGQAAFNALGGTIDFSGTTGLAGDGQITAGSIAGAAAGRYNLGTNTLTVGSNNMSTAVAGIISGAGGSLTKIGTGTLTLSGANTYTGTTRITAGTLAVTAGGSIAGPALLTGGTLTGAGTLANLSATGGIFAPGNGTAGASDVVTGTLQMTSAAQYSVQVDPTTASLAKVNGTATLGGASVNAAFANGSYFAKQYTILTATGGRSGTFGTLTTTNAPTNFSTSLSYDDNDAYLNLALKFTAPAGLNRNQQSVANAITGYFNATGGVPAAFAVLNANGLTQTSGEIGTGTQQATINAMGLFLGAMTQPFTGEDAGTVATGTLLDSDDPNALAYAPPRRTSAAAAAIAHKAPVKLPIYEPRWTVWSLGFGGSQTTDGNTATGSNTATSRIYGGGLGLGYRVSPDTLVGVLLAGGGTSFSVANGGSGHSDLFQAGAFVRHTAGPAYITGALAYGWQDVTTSRTAIADRLTARFNTDTFAGRLEGGYRFSAPSMLGFGLTSYGAGQFTAVYLPNYNETAASGGASTFALSYAAKDVTVARSELGFRADKSFAAYDGVMTLRGRVAWAHNFNPGRSINATFQTLPGASFVVNGAAQARDSALVSASAEMRWRSGWSLAATFEGEFSGIARSYAGKGIIRYAW